MFIMERICGIILLSSRADRLGSSSVWRIYSLLLNISLKNDTLICSRSNASDMLVIRKVVNIHH